MSCPYGRGSCRCGRHWTNGRGGCGLRLWHEQIDRAVLAAYAATDGGGGWSEDGARVGGSDRSS